MDKFISYAPNFEDVMLWRALQGVEHGFYIDVGANHPVFDSVTKAFYERNWRGINIEPLPSLYDDLVANRLHDVNLCCAVSSTSGQVEFYEVVGTGLSTLEADLAEAHAKSGYVVRTHQMLVKTLADICAEYGVTEVHFLKIDVEGAEEKVLRGMPFERIKPWVVVVEATRPNTQIPTHQAWEPILLAQGYDLAYFDGVNRYYLSQLHNELAWAFEVPVNVFDNFVTYPYWLCQQDNKALRDELGKCQIRLAEIRASWSWRLTKPFRGVSALIALLRRRGSDD